MSQMRLTELSIKALKPCDPHQTFYDQSLPGFGVRVGKRRKTFIVMKGRERTRISLGHFPETTLAEARAAAKKILAGTEPQPFKSLSYGDALDLYIKHHLNYTSRAHRTEAERLLRRHFPFKTLDEIDRKAVVPILDELTPSIRDHALRRLKAFLNWCVDRDYLQNNALIRLKSGGGTTKRDRVLSDDELRRIWHACLQLGTFGRIVQMLLLTGCRRSEIADLRREWIQGDSLVIPKEHTKGKREHIIPLPSFSHSLMASLPTQSPFVFSAREKSETPFNGWSQNKRKLDKLSGTSDWRLHDLRRTFRTNLSAWKCCDSDTAERLIGHKVGSEVSRIYDRYDRLPEKREAMERYTAHLQRVIGRTTS